MRTTGLDAFEPEVQKRNKGWRDWQGRSSVKQRKGCAKGRGLNQDYIRVQEEEQEAKVCKRERGQPLQKQPQATEQGGGREKGIGRPAETKEHRTKSKNTNTVSQLYLQHIQLDINI